MVISVLFLFTSNQSFQTAIDNKIRNVNSSLTAIDKFGMRKMNHIGSSCHNMAFAIPTHPVFLLRMLYNIAAYRGTIRYNSGRNGNAIPNKNKSVYRSVDIHRSHDIPSPITTIHIPAALHIFRSSCNQHNRFRSYKPALQMSTQYFSDNQYCRQSPK